MKLRLAFYGAALGLCFAPILLAQDAAKTDPAHYTVVSDNHQVRILKVHYGPHEKSPVMHSHPATVVVFLTDANGRFNYPGGKSEDFTGKAGDARYNDATTHQPENTGDAEMDAIVIELKGKGPTPAAAALAQDVVKTVPEHHSVMSENNQVRILKVHYGPHEKSAIHSHPAGVVVFLTECKQHITNSNGKTEDVDHKAGEAVYQPATTHTVENTGDAESEAIMIELKGRTH